MATTSHAQHAPAPTEQTEPVQLGVVVSTIVRRLAGAGDVVAALTLIVGGMAAIGFASLI